MTAPSPLRPAQRRSAAPGSARPARRPGLAALALVLAAGPVATPLAAQERTPGGVWLEMRLQQRFEAVRETNEDSGAEESRQRSRTGLDLTLSSETRSRRLAFTFGGALEGVRASDTDRNQPLALTAPSAGLSFRQAGPASEFTAGLRYDSQDLAFSNSLRDLLDDEDTTQDDIDADDDSGTRHSTRLSLGYRGGIDGPLSFGASLTYSDIRYTDLNAGSDRTDETRLSARLNASAELTPALRLNGGLSFNRTEETDTAAEPEESVRLDLALSTTVRGDRIGLTFGLQSDDDGERSSVGASWSRDLQGGDIAANIALSRAVDDSLGWTGGLRYSQDLRNGSVNLRWTTGFGSNDDDEESRRNRLSAGYRQQLTALTGFGISLATARTEALGDGDRTDRVEVGVSLSHQLTEFWSLDVGARRSIESETGTDTISSDTLFFTIGRGFARRF
jgi:hypothetical protein